MAPDHFSALGLLLRVCGNMPLTMGYGFHAFIQRNYIKPPPKFQENAKTLFSQCY